MSEIAMSEILTIGEAAKILNLSTQRIRQLERSGRLSCSKTSTGWRIFQRSEVENFRREREQFFAKGEPRYLKSVTKAHDAHAKIYGLPIPPRGY